MKAKETMLGSEIILLPGKEYVPASSLCLNIRAQLCLWNCWDHFKSQNKQTRKNKDTPLEMVKYKRDSKSEVHSILIEQCPMFLWRVGMGHALCVCEMSKRTMLDTLESLSLAICYVSFYTEFVLLAKRYQRTYARCLEFNIDQYCIVI